MPRTKGRGNIVSASFESVSKLDGASSELVYIPHGKSEIDATVNGKPKSITVNASADILPKFQADLAKRMERNVKPITDFDHAKKGPNSSHPQSFSYDERGLILHTDWTGSGKRGIEEKDYEFFSADFLIKDGVPQGIPMRGPIGTLTNDPAFEQIPAVAAAYAEADDDLTNNTDNMKSLAEIGILTENEAAKEDAVTVAAARWKATKAEPEEVRAAAISDIQSNVVNACKAKDIDPADVGLAEVVEAGATTDVIAKGIHSLVVAAANARVAASKAIEEKADARIVQAVEAGRIKSQDEETKSFWKDQLLNNFDKADKVLASMAKIAPGITKREIDKVSASAGDLDTITAELVSAGRAKTASEATVIAFREHPELYESYREKQYGGSAE